MKVKTTIVKGVPWPAKDAEVKGRTKKDREETGISFEPFPKGRTKEERVVADINFEAWVKRQKAEIDFNKIFGRAQ